MSEPTKDKIVEALQEAKSEGSLRVERIREIARGAVSQTASEVRSGAKELRPVIKSAIAAAVEVFRDKGSEIKEEVSAVLEGAIAGIRDTRGGELARTQSEIGQLQKKVDSEEIQLQKDIDAALDEAEQLEASESENVRESVRSAVESVKNSEEVALLRKRYAQLKAQLAIVQANLAERYGDSRETVEKYLDEAKTWYERVKEDPDLLAEQVSHKRQEFESKLGEAGGAIARREGKIKQVLRELWHSVVELFRDEKETSKKE